MFARSPIVAALAAAVLALLAGAASAVAAPARVDGLDVALTDGTTRAKGTGERVNVWIQPAPGGDAAAAARAA
ncbi:MAG TPA: hypothetical protein VN238_21650, partial [Solirubrobacteraceae bacterium]|nr:hypothetical protein [Solirubrobacteraceae bacterium]